MADVRASLQGLVCGPMVGHTTPDASSLWVLPDPDREVEVRFGRSETLERTVFARSSRTPHSPLVLSMTGLQPRTPYRYQVFVDGRTTEEQSGSFRTAPGLGEARDFSFAMASCIKSRGFWRDSRQVAWRSLIDAQPDLLVLLGDCTYANSPHESRLWSRHMHQRGVPNYARTVRHVPTYAVWDDHDYYDDNADGDKDPADKAESLGVFRKLWALPEREGMDFDGVTSTWSWGQADFFLLDGRFHRSDRRGVMLGDAQLNWLAERLAASSALVKFVGSGSCLSDGGNGWKAYPTERARFLEVLASVPNVFYLSGDIHECKLREHAVGAGRVVHELISSGLARTRKPFRPPTHRYVSVQVTLEGDRPCVEAVIRDSNGRPQGRRDIDLVLK